MIYLDHAATTPVLPEVLEAMLPWFQPDHVGNASSIHTQGVNALRAVENAREQVAKMINADMSEIFFTSGGTESNNTFARYIKGEWVVTTKIEHHSVPHPLEEWAYDVSYAKNLPDGSVDMDDLNCLLNSCCHEAVSVIWVNNELGTINPVEEIAALCKKRGLLFHVDAVQAAGHIPIDVKKCGMDFLSISGHKFGAPPGVGVFYVRNGVPKRALISGGGQENGMRAGTYNVPGIVGLGKAAEIAERDIASNLIAWEALRKRFIKRLESSMPGQFQINGGCHVSPSIISLTIPGVNSESLLLRLDADGIQVSAGSACSASDHAVSHVLAGIGMPDDLASSTIRISMGTTTTEEDMTATADAITKYSAWLKSLF